jgi:hypothetical protein
LFLDKLQQKDQPADQRAQAQKAVRLYYSGLDQANEQQTGVAQSNIAEAGRLFDTEPPADPWSDAMESLKNEISVRHLYESRQPSAVSHQLTAKRFHALLCLTGRGCYSKKTWKAYSLWAQKLRYFVKEKPPETLNIEDVKDFLTFLAVNKKVSASSQNQAFNALLFFSVMY